MTTAREDLKSVGFRFVTILKPHRGLGFVPRPHSDRRLGIEGGHCSPMDCFNWYLDRNSKVSCHISDELVKLGWTRFSPNVGSNFSMTSPWGDRYFFSWQSYPTYDRSCGLDSGYATYWLTFTKI